MVDVVECEDHKCGVWEMTTVDLTPLALGNAFNTFTNYESCASEDQSAGAGLYKRQG